MSDRRRANGPPGGTVPAVFRKHKLEIAHGKTARRPNTIRKIWVIPSASGSSYVEFQQNVPGIASSVLFEGTPTVKISCAVHGPKPVPRSAPFSTNLLLSTHVKFAPFATRVRRGYIRDSTERDLAVHVETALRSIVIAERWPKSGVDVVLTVLEGDEQFSAPSGLNATFGPDSLGLMSILSGCITAASVALMDAGIDCVDIVTGGVAALVPTGSTYQVVQDPLPSEHGNAVAACVIGYLRSRDEYADVWMLCGPLSESNSHDVSNQLLDGAVQAAVAAQRVVVDILNE